MYTVIHFGTSKKDYDTKCYYLENSTYTTCYIHCRVGIFVDSKSNQYVNSVCVHLYHKKVTEMCEHRFFVENIQAHKMQWQLDVTSSNNFIFKMICAGHYTCFARK